MQSDIRHRLGPTHIFVLREELAGRDPSALSPIARREPALLLWGRALSAFAAQIASNGIARCLETGAFVFLYVGRDLDERTRRIMTYLADGARMTFFAVEVDHFHAGDAHTSVLVPRTAFVPSWVTAPVGMQDTATTPTIATASAKHVTSLAGWMRSPMNWG